MKEKLIAQIVDQEWKMFQNVANIGGRAACQDNYDTFKVMRRSQTMAWSEAALSSYLDDLRAAQDSGRNLLTERYARMMEHTEPQEYECIKEYLPVLDEQARLLIDKIIEANMEWTEEIRTKFPYIRKRGRPASADSDSPYNTSVETYLRGELATYSTQTLELYYQNVLEQKSRQINGTQIVLDTMVQSYGFNSLDEANKAIRAQN